MEDYIQQIVDRGVPFEDAEFPKHGELNGVSNFEWKRASSAIDDAKMLGNDQIIQGSIPDCYLITALTVVSSRPDLLKKLILTKNINSCGVYGFQFFHSYDNEWKKIIIDDYIPFKGRKPLFARFSNKKNVIWPLLLEKAYAKLYGGYDNIAGGNVSETLLDLTGCPVEDFVLGKVEVKCAQMKKWLSLGFLVACAKVTPNPRYDHLMDGNMSLIKNHAYSIEKVLIKNKKGLVGAKISKSEPTGLIWMSYKQFLENFNRVYCCKTSRNVKECYFARGVTWTGSQTRLWRNPIFKVTNRGEEDVRAVVTISQKSKRHEKVMEHKLSYDMIGFNVVSSSTGKGIPNTMCLTYGDYKVIYKTSLWNKRDVSSGFPVKRKSVCYLVPINYNNNATIEQSTFSLRLDCREGKRVEVQRMIPFTNPSSYLEEEEEEEETEGENPGSTKENIAEKLIVRKKFSAQCGKIGESVASNPISFIYVKEKCSLYVYLCQKKKPYDGVGIFVLKNTVGVKSTSNSKVVAKKGFTNPADLGLEVNASGPCVLMVVFVPFKRSAKMVEMRVVADWGKIEAYDTKEELLEKRKDEVEKLCARKSGGGSSSSASSATKPRTGGGKRRGRGGRTGRRGRAGRTTGGVASRRGRRGRGTGTRRRATGRGGGGNVGGMGATSSMMANLYAGLE